MGQRLGGPGLEKQQSGDKDRLHAGSGKVRTGNQAIQPLSDHPRLPVNTDLAKSLLLNPNSHGMRSRVWGRHRNAEDLILRV